MSQNRVEILTKKLSINVADEIVFTATRSDCTWTPHVRVPVAILLRRSTDRHKQLPGKISSRNSIHHHHLRPAMIWWSTRLFEQQTPTALTASIRADRVVHRDISSVKSIQHSLQHIRKYAINDAKQVCVHL